MDSLKNMKIILKFNLELSEHLLNIMQAIEEDEHLDIDEMLTRIEDFCQKHPYIVNFNTKRAENHFEIEISSDVLPISYFQHILNYFFGLFPYTYSKLIKSSDGYVMRFDKKAEGKLVSIKVSILDDNEAILELLTQFFNKHDDNKYTFHVYSTTEPDLFQSYVAAKHVDVLIVDEKFPDGHSGIEILKELKDSSPDSIKVMVTGYPEFSLAQEAINRGYIDLFIPKPVKRADFMNLICQELDGKIEPR